MEEQKTEDYKERLQKARQRRNGKDPMHWFMIGGCAVIVVLALVIIVKLAQGGTFGGSGNARVASASEAEAQETVIGETLPEDEEQAKEDEEKKNVVESYQNLGIVDVSGYLNMRESASTTSDVIGKLMGGSACEILDDSQEGWYQVSSGGLEGYISSEFVQTGEAAKTEAFELVKKMAVITTDKLNIRSEPSVNNYLNIRVEPKEDAKIIGKMTSKSGGEILETTEDGGWYKIKSGPVTGYVKSEFILTGDAAKQEALQVAQLMAIVSTDRLNARTEPNTDAPIWTQISNSERYSVMSQQDGWVQIALDETSAYVATEFVDVRYALNEAIEFTPVEETPEPETKAASSKGGSGSKSSSNGGSGSQKASSSGSSKRAQIANYATQFLGNPYVWGGTSLTNGTDCSGFTMSVMAHFGVGLPHHSGSQAGAGRSISSSQMRPGDLIFYTNSGGTINHVALYIGGGRVCHASNARDGIKISTWNYRTPAKIVNVLGD